MSFYKVKLRPTDILFSKFIRAKANYTCERCGRHGLLDGEVVYQMQASHYHLRKNEATRFDPENVYCLCVTCHERMGSYHKTEDREYDLFVKQRIGEQRYKLLTIRANSTKKRDDYLDMLTIVALIRESGLEGVLPIPKRLKRK